MNTTTTRGARGAPPSSQPVTQRPVAPGRAVATRSSLADRLALRLGMALVIWSRQHGARSDARRLAVALRGETEIRRARQFAGERRATAGLPWR